MRLNLIFSQAKNVKIHLPVDFVCGTKLDASSEAKEYDLKSQIPDGWLGLDAGTLTRQINADAIGRAKTSRPIDSIQLVVWNGPQGAFEIEKFRSGSIAVLDALEQVTKRGGTTIVGGGDTVSLV